MRESEKRIHDWQEKIQSEFGNEAKLYQYLFETMDNFYYRYLETTENKNLKTTQLAPEIWGSESAESNMVEALKIKNPLAKPGIIELAKTFPKAQKPSVRYSLIAEVRELTANRGHLVLKSIINWGFPTFTDPKKLMSKEVVFVYDDLAVFRKDLALKLEEVAEIFI